MKMNNQHNIFLTLILLMFSLNTWAQNNPIPKQEQPKIKYVVGIGIGMAPQYEGSNEIFVLPGLTASANWKTGQYIRFGGLGLNANILKSKTWEFGPRLAFQLPRSETFVKNEQINALEDIDFSLSPGIFTRFKFGKGFDIQMTYAQDVSGVSDGGLMDLELSYRWRKKRLIHQYSINTSYGSENYLNTYFGINEENIGSSTFKFHKLDGGFKNIGTNWTSIYVINKNWMLIGRLSYSLLLNDVARSPIVEIGNKNQWSGGLIAMYRF